MIVKNFEKQEKNTAVFTVESDAAEFEKAVNTAYQKNKGSINIPGFRKGKAPRAIVEGMFNTLPLFVKTCVVPTIVTPVLFFSYFQTPLVTTAAFA